MADIPLHGSLAAGRFAIVSDEDCDAVSQHRWHLSTNGYPIANIRNVHGKTATVTLHRFLMQTPKGLDTDHANGNKLDNRRDNLRIATRSQNISNKPVRKDNQSGMKGVRWHSHNRSWQARITVAGRSISLGYFSTKEAAAEAFASAARTHYGEYAWS